MGGGAIPKGKQLPDGLLPGGDVELLGTTEVFDTDTNTWSSLASMPTPRNHHSVTYADGKIYAIGGRVGSCYSGGWSNNIWMNEAYDIATNTWATRAPMPTARSGTGIVSVSGKIHVLGGGGLGGGFGGGFWGDREHEPASNAASGAGRVI